MSTSPTSTFVKNVTVQRRDGTGADKLINCTVLRIEGARTVEWEITSPAEFFAALADVFGLTLDDLDEDRGRLWRTPRPGRRRTRRGGQPCRRLSCWPALRARGRPLAVAESLTGGLLAATIVDVPGASRVFRGGLIVYATDLKATLAGVPADLLAERGPVDPDVAAALARGARERCGARLGLCAPPAWPVPTRRTRPPWARSSSPSPGRCDAGTRRWRWPGPGRRSGPARSAALDLLGVLSGRRPRAG